MKKVLLYGIAVMVTVILSMFGAKAQNIITVEKKTQTGETLKLEFRKQREHFRQKGNDPNLAMVTVHWEVTDAANIVMLDITYMEHDGKRYGNVVNRLPGNYEGNFDPFYAKKDQPYIFKAVMVYKDGDKKLIVEKMLSVNWNKEEIEAYEPAVITPTNSLAKNK
jgi:hypothetical protein